MSRAVSLITMALLLTVVAGCRPPLRGNGRNLLLITIETTRADHLGAYGYERDTSPFLDRLAREGALFDRTFSVSPRTNPSLASLMTSSYPHEHGVRNLLLPLEPEQLTLAEVLRGAGYVTGAVQTHPRLVAASGFAQGFDDYADDYTSHPLAVQSCQVAASWIRERAAQQRPWFMWLHLMDPHWTYDPPSPWRTRYGPDDPRPARLYRDLAERRRTIGPVVFQNTMPPDEVQAFVDLYDAEIRFTDDSLAALFAQLEQLGVREKTVVALTADHGESLGQHDYFFEHGDFGTDGEIHVPLIVVDAGRVPGGVRVPATVSQLDLAPTLLELLELPHPDRFRGTSLMPLIITPNGADRRCFGETGKRFHPQNVRREVEGVRGKWRWLRHGAFKLMHVPTAEGRVDWRLYDLATDPGETRDVSHEHPAVLARMRAELQSWVGEDPGEERDYHVSPEVMEELRSLGYVD